MLGIAGVDGSETSGPDYYRVAGVESGESLDVRIGPATTLPIVGQIPAESNGLANFGCIDTETSDRWCLIGYSHIIGWVTRNFLMESDGSDEGEGDARLERLAESRWRATRLGEEAVVGDTNLAFTSGGQAVGLSGCNRFIGDFTENDGVLTISQVATTRKKCTEPLMALERRFLFALKAAHRGVATRSVLALIDDENIVLGQFERHDRK